MRLLYIFVFHVGFINKQERLHQVPFYPFQVVLIAFMNFKRGEGGYNRKKVLMYFMDGP